MSDDLSKRAPVTMGAIRAAEQPPGTGIPSEAAAPPALPTPPAVNTGPTA